MKAHCEDHNLTHVYPQFTYMIFIYSYSYNSAELLHFVLVVNKVLGVGYLKVLRVDRSSTIAKEPESQIPPN